MKAYCDKEPLVLEALGNGAYQYRYNIVREEVKDYMTGDAEPHVRVQWAFDYVNVWSPITANRITEAVIRAEIPGNHEQKLVNEYNAAQMGLTTGAEAEKAVARYKGWLELRERLKRQVDGDCGKLRIAK